MIRRVLGAAQIPAVILIVSLSAGCSMYPEGIPTDFKRRVVDRIDGKSIVEYEGSLHGVLRRYRYMVDTVGERPLDLINLSAYIWGKYPGASTPRDVIIRDFIRLHNPWETIVLSLESDIPGFRREELDPDLQRLRLQPVEIRKDGKVVSITYAWTAVGGKLKRYRFKSSPAAAPHGRSCVILQTDVGVAKHLL